MLFLFLVDPLPFSCETLAFSAKKAVDEDIAAKKRRQS